MGLRDSTSTSSLQREIGQVAVGRQAECSGRWLCSARACDRNGQGLRRNLKLQVPMVGNTRRGGGEDSKPTIALIQGWRVRCRRKQVQVPEQSINDGGRDGLGSPSQSVKSDSQRRARACAAGPFDVGCLVLVRNQELFGGGAGRGPRKWEWTSGRGRRHLSIIRSNNRGPWSWHPDGLAGRKTAGWLPQGSDNCCTAKPTNRRVDLVGRYVCKW